MPSPLRYEGITGAPHPSLWSCSLHSTTSAQRGEESSTSRSHSPLLKHVNVESPMSLIHPSTIEKTSGRLDGTTRRPRP